MLKSNVFSALNENFYCIGAVKRAREETDKEEPASKQQKTENHVPALRKLTS